MTSNAELVKQALEAVDREGWEVFLDLVHPEFELITPGELAMEPDTYRGPDGLRRYFESFEDAMEDIRIVPEGEVVERSDKVFIPFRLSARGRETGIEATQHAFQVWTLRGGKAVRAVVFASREDALREAGLPSDA